MSLKAYKKTIKETETPRDIERRVITQITGRLSSFKDAFDASDEPLSTITEELRLALWDNQRLWITIKADLLSDGNKLSNELKADLVSLAIWVDNHTNNVLNGDAKIGPLIEVNQNIISGLSK